MKSFYPSPRHCVPDKILTPVIRINWRLNICDVHDLPVVEDGKLVIHCIDQSQSSISSIDQSEPLTIECDVAEKLTSIRLALEYAVLLTMPYSCSSLPRIVE